MTEDKSKDPKLAERKKELEDELDRYAQAGVSSPGVVKAARWISRGMYLVMGAVVVVVLWTNHDAVPRKDFEAQKKVASDNKKKYEEARAETTNVIEKLNLTINVAGKKQAEASAYIDGHIAAKKAELAAQLLISSYRGEVAYGIAWREQLAKADLSAIEGDPVEHALVLMEQASVLPAASRHEALRELHELGEKAVTAAAIHAFSGNDMQLALVAVSVFVRLNHRETAIIDLADGASVEMARKLAFASSILAPAAPSKDHGGVYHLAEAWVGYVLLADDVNVDPLVDAYKSAPEEHRFELLALLAEVAGTNQSDFFSQIATQGRDGEKLIAVHWMGNRLDALSKTLLETLSAGKGEIGIAAQRALKRIQDAQGGND